LRGHSQRSGLWLWHLYRQQSRIFINETVVTKAFDVPIDLVYTDLKGNIMSGTIEVGAFESDVIMQK
jgi:hypothetical protein